MDVNEIGQGFDDLTSEAGTAQVDVKLLFNVKYFHDRTFPYGEAVLPNT